MIAAQQEEVLRVLNLVAQQQADCLDGLLASIDVVSQEQVVGLGRKATVFKYAQKIVILTMNVTLNCQN